MWIFLSWQRGHSNLVAVRGLVHPIQRFCTQGSAVIYRATFAATIATTRLIVGSLFEWVPSTGSQADKLGSVFCRGFRRYSRLWRKWWIIAITTILIVEFRLIWFAIAIPISQCAKCRIIPLCMPDKSSPCPTHYRLQPKLRRCPGQCRPNNSKSCNRSARNSSPVCSPSTDSPIKFDACCLLTAWEASVSTRWLIDTNNYYEQRTVSPWMRCPNESRLSSAN